MEKNQKLEGLFELPKEIDLCRGIIEEMGGQVYETETDVADHISFPFILDGQAYQLVFPKPNGKGYEAIVLTPDCSETISREYIGTNPNTIRSNLNCLLGNLQ